MKSINPKLNARRLNYQGSLDELYQALHQGDRASLSRGLTLVESNFPGHRKQANALIQMALAHSGKSIRLGITGVPGVGKSTFIESFGEYLISLGKKVAVLAIDPSSSKSKGSILGDKTRMQELSRNSQAFIRPTPSSGSLGGVSGATRESILLCEAAGYDVIIIETVGVGQSETTVKSMVDFFMLLMLAGAGDELQGIKRGIMEMADLLAINKADGTNLQAAKQAEGEYKRALHLFPPSDNDWIPRVMSVSSIESRGIEDVWGVIEEFSNQQRLNGNLEENRKNQMLAWFKEALNWRVLEKFYANPQKREQIAKMEAAISSGNLTPPSAISQIFN